MRRRGVKFANFQKVTLLFLQSAYRLMRKLFRMVAHFFKKLHYYAAQKPHLFLMKHVRWYKKWHQWDYRSHAHSAIIVPYVFIIGAILLFTFKSAFAADLTTTWDFSTSSQFSFDSNTIETEGSSARLKAQNYISDGTTQALYHFDETSGITAADSSSNANTANVINNTSFTAGILSNAVSLDGNGDYVSVLDSASISLGGQHTIEAWTKFDTPFDSSASHDQGIVDKGNYRLYYNSASGKINYEIANTTGNSWTRQAGLDTNASWDADGKTIVRTTATDGSNKYVGLGLGTGDAEVWHWNGTVWNKVGGDGINGSWADQVFEDVNDLVIDNGILYAALGTSTAGDAEVWSCVLSANCNDWTKIGGDGINSGWAISTFESVNDLTAYGSNVYAALGNSANDAEVWRWNGTAWTKIGGDSLNSGWTTNYEAVQNIVNDGTNLYAGLGNTAGDSEVWRWNGTAWTKIGGDGVASSWATADNIEYVYSMHYFGGNLYVGTGSTAGDGDVWRYNGTAWTKIGGDGLNSGWAASTFELVGALTNDGTNLYAGLGNSNGDGEVYRWNGTAWTKIGGDGINSGWSTNQGDGVYSLAFDGGVLSAGLYDSAGNATYWEWTGTAWSLIGGGYVNKSWGFYNLQSVESSMTFEGRLYVGTGVSVAGNAQVWQFDGTTWEIIGGQGVNNSWTQDTYENVYTLQSFEGQLYAGLGTSANDAEVWRYDGSTWTKVGGDSLNSGWTTNYEGVYSLTPYNGDLYAGLGASANDAEVWRWDGSVWAKVGGDSLNSGWTTNYETVYAMTVYDDQLYASLGASTGDAEIWRYDGSTWTKVGGDGLSGSWNTVYEEVYVMRIYNGNLVAGLGSGTADAEIWQYDGATWTKIGGDDVNNSWSDGTYERVRSMAIYNGELYTGIGDTTGDGEVWRWDGTTWVKIGGNNLNSGWTSVVEYVSTLIDFRGKLYAGTGFSGNADAAVWSYGNNGYLSSTQTSQDDQWHHIAATYNGTSMRIYIDGVLDASEDIAVTMPDNTLPLYIGSTYGSGGRGEAQGYFKGQIDEVRLSSSARTAFNTVPYSTTKQTVALTNAAFTSGIRAYEGFLTSETLNGGSIGYQLSVDDGQTWQHWDGSTWAVASSLNDANVAVDVNTHIQTLPVTFSGVKWRAVLSSDGMQQTRLNSVTVTANSDITDPSVNASNVVARKTNGGSSLGSNAWTNGASPYFSWDAGADGESGILGYCLYLGQDNAADPTTTKGLLGTSPVSTGGNCQFITDQPSIDLGTANILGSALTTSTAPYYLLVSAIDKAGNIVASPAEFQFRFDNTAPSNPSFISAPSGFINTKEATLSWATSGGQAASDDASGLAGLQYRIGSSTWYGDTHDGTGTNSDLLANDGSYTTISTPDFDNIVDGTNTVYFRTWDQAGNVTTSYVSAALKINTDGSPSEPLNLAATPSSNTTNSFSFTWDTPVSYVGDANTLNYCYSINTAPSAVSCTYTGAGIRTLASGPYATLPGVNTLYVAAKDESGSINYASYGSVEFTANTTAPGIAGNLDIVDVSIKASSKWRLAITWDIPTSNADAVASYRIYRSTDASTYSLAGTSSSTTYIDAGLSQIMYYYRVSACDSTNNCSANSSVVSLLPTGKFTEAASLIGEPGNSNITTKRATVSWTTDRASDSKIALGTSSGQYGASEIGNSDQVSAHSIDLDNLAAGTTYYYIVKWTDVDGNTGTSQEYTFTTSPAPVVKEVITSKIGLSDAIIAFTSVNATKINVYYGVSESFGGLQTINTSNDESSYSINLAGLNDGTRYVYQLSAVDSEGTEYKGNIFSFTTPQRPRITNLRFQPVEGQPTSTQSVTWSTNVASTSTVTYGKIGSNGTDIQISKLETAHTVTIKGLEDDSEYFLIAQSRDADGNLAVSDQQNFRTALDTRPPSVSAVNIESTIRGSGSEARGQVIISWTTDEPATSQVGYAEGSTATVFNNKTSEDTQLTTQHIVVLSNLPTSKVYSIQVMSYDKARNIGTSEAQTAIIGRANESVLTLILSSLQRIFGL